MKLLLSFIFSMSIFCALNAQEGNKQTLFTGGILLDNFILHESYTQVGNSDRISTVITPGTAATYLGDGHEMRGQLSLGLKKINENGHSVAFNVFAGRNTWARKKITVIENEALNAEIAVPIYIGNVKQNTFGGNVTKSFCVTKEETRLKAYLGARAEAIYTTAEYTADLEGEFAKNREKTDLQAVFVPEAVYFFPGDKFAMSIGLNLPIAGLELNKVENFDPNLSEEQRNSSYTNFDFVNFGKARFEMGFSWIL